MKVPASDYPMRKLHDFFFKFNPRRLGSVQYAIIKTRVGRFCENPSSGADLVVTPETNSLGNFFVFLRKVDIRPQGNPRVINTL